MHYSTQSVGVAKVWYGMYIANFMTLFVRGKWKGHGGSDLHHPRILLCKPLIKATDFLVGGKPIARRLVVVLDPRGMVCSSTHCCGCVATGSSEH